MEWQTKVEVEVPAFTLDYNSRMMLLGSFFAVNMGEKLKYFSFDAEIKPCGIVYNPLSVAAGLTLLLDKTVFTAEKLVFNCNKWVSLLHHGSFASSDQAEALRKINEGLARASSVLPHLNLLLITFGTSWVYRWKESGEVVANCHKFPADCFVRSRLSVEEIVVTYLELFRRLREVNPGLKIVFTVSPIRHWKDGAHGNQLSKAVLLLAIDELKRQCKDVYYFPSYEIVMDELRDYRFYAEDMLHISVQGVNYIWQRFREAYFNPSTLKVMQQVERINKGLNHRPYEPESGEYRKFRQQLIDELNQLCLRYPYMNRDQSVVSGMSF